MEKKRRKWNEITAQRKKIWKTRPKQNNESEWTIFPIERFSNEVISHILMVYLDGGKVSMKRIHELRLVSTKWKTIVDRIGGCDFCREDSHFCIDFSFFENNGIVKTKVKYYPLEKTTKHPSWGFVFNEDEKLTKFPIQFEEPSIHIIKATLNKMVSLPPREKFAQNLDSNRRRVITALARTGGIPSEVCLSCPQGFLIFPLLYGSDPDDLLSDNEQSENEESEGEKSGTVNEDEYDFMGEEESGDEGKEENIENDEKPFQSESDLDEIRFLESSMLVETAFLDLLMYPKNRKERKSDIQMEDSSDDEGGEDNELEANLLDEEVESLPNNPPRSLNLPMRFLEFTLSFVMVTEIQKMKKKSVECSDSEEERELEQDKEDELSIPMF